MELLLHHEVGDEIERDGYLELLRQNLGQKGHPKPPITQLRRAFDAAVLARQVAAQVANPQEPPEAVQATGLRQAFGDSAEIPDRLVMPAGWRVGLDGVWLVPSCPRADGTPAREVLVLPTPLVVTRRLLEIQGELEYWELAWRRDGRWKRKGVDRAIPANRLRIVELAADGLPVTSENASLVVQYLAAFEAANLGALPRCQVSNALGWVNEQHIFLWGRTPLQVVPAAQPCSWTQGTREAHSVQDVLFQGADAGDEQIADGFHAQGTMEDWRAHMAPVLGQHKVRLGVLASLCSPLLEILGVPNPIVEYCGDTSRGKTITLRAAASCWGNPNEKSTKAAISGWDITRVGAERLLATVNNLPLILDDTSRCKHKEILSQVIYDTVAGQGRRRGSLKGCQRTGTWSTVLLSSGESSVNAYAEHGGARARVLTLWGSPFGEVTQETGNTVKALDQGVRANYGHAGPAFVRFLLQNRDRWAQWKRWWQCIMHKFHEWAGNNPVLGRMADVFATLTLAGVLAAKALNLPMLARNAIRPLWTELGAQATEADVPTRALRYVYDWARSHQQDFHGRAPRTGDGPRQPSAGWAGRWDPPEQPWEHIAFFPNRIAEILRQGSFEPDACLRAWKERGWLALDGAGQRIQVRIQGQRASEERARMVALRRQVLDTLDSGDPCTHDRNPPWLYTACRLFQQHVLKEDQRLAVAGGTIAHLPPIQRFVREAVERWLANNPPGDGTTQPAPPV
jgi:hypothetical protein